MKRILLALCLLAAPAQAAVVAGWPDNVITVTDSATDSDCTSTIHNPYDECTGSVGVASPSINGFEGNDIVDALLLAQTAQGGIVDLGCHEYQRAEVHLYSSKPAAGSARHGPRSGQVFDLGFPNGLMIRGTRPTAACPGGTILHSRSGSTGPAWTSDPTASIFFYRQWDPSDSTTEGIPRISFRDFECDGDSDLQPSPELMGGGYDTAHMEIFHQCIQSKAAYARHYRYGEVMNVWAHHFTGQGIQVADTDQAVIVGNTVNNIGCWQSYSAATVCDTATGPYFTTISDECQYPGNPSPILGCRPTCCTGLGVGANCSTNVGGWANNAAVVGEVQCGCGAADAEHPDPGKCRGWNVSAEDNQVSVHSPGFKAAAFGINVGDRGVATVVGNTVSYVTKYALVHASEGWAVRSPNEYGHFRGNTALHSTVGFMGGTSDSSMWADYNTCTGMGIQGNLVTSVGCFQSSGPSRLIRYENNSIVGPGSEIGSHGGGIMINSTASDESVSPNIILKNNVIEETGDWQAIQNSASYAAPIGWAPNFADPCPSGSYPDYQVKTKMVVDGNTITTGSAGYAGMQLAVDWTAATCPANMIDPLVIKGTNSISPTTYSGHTTDLSRIFAKNIVAIGMVLNGTGSAGTLTWLTGSTGACSGFTLNSGAHTTGGALTADCP